jgi:hypothetical protein
VILFAIFRANRGQPQQKQKATKTLYLQWFCNDWQKLQNGAKGPF